MLNGLEKGKRNSICSTREEEKSLSFESIMQTKYLILISSRIPNIIEFNLLDERFFLRNPGKHGRGKDFFENVEKIER